MKKIYLGIIVAFICGISDVLLLYHPTLIDSYSTYDFLFQINPIFNLSGWLLGMVCLPMLFIGYQGAIEIADENSKKPLQSNQWMVIFLIATGCVVHSVYHFIPTLANPIEKLSNTQLISIKLIELIFVMFYIMFGITIFMQSLKKKNTLLFANRFFHPFIWMVISTVTFMVIPVYGGSLMVSAFNLSIGFYFIGMSLTSKK